MCERLLNDFIYCIWTFDSRQFVLKSIKSCPLLILLLLLIRLQTRGNWKTNPPKRPNDSDIMYVKLNAHPKIKQIMASPRSRPLCACAAAVRNSHNKRKWIAHTTNEHIDQLLNSNAVRLCRRRSALQVSLLPVFFFFCFVFRIAAHSSEWK